MSIWLISMTFFHFVIQWAITHSLAVDWYARNYVMTVDAFPTIHWQHAICYNSTVQYNQLIASLLPCVPISRNCYTSLVWCAMKLCIQIDVQHSLFGKKKWWKHKCKIIGFYRRSSKCMQYSGLGHKNHVWHVYGKAAYFYLLSSSCYEDNGKRSNPAPTIISTVLKL